MKTKRKSVCPYDCPDCCGLIITIEDGKAVHVEGDPEHTFTRGTLCPKMAHYERTVHSPLRLTTPLQRVGKKGEGKFVPISWEDAISAIAANWQETIKTYGAEAIMPYSYAGTMGIIQHNAYHALFYLLGASSLDRTICAPAKGVGYREVMGKTLVTAPQEAQHSDLIVLWSLSMLATDIHFKHDVDIARQHGAKIYCVDTYETQTAKFADHFVRVKPGTDGALALGIMYILNRDQLLDEAFIAEHVQGWPELRDTILPKYTPEKVAQITELPVDELEAFAHAYGTAKAPFIRLGSGQSRYGNGAMTSRLITCLPALVGAYQHTGGGLLTSISGGHAFNRQLITRPDLEKSGVRHLNMIKLGEILTSKTLNPPVKSLYIYSSNPACTAPDQNKVLAGLQREDLFTVVHERFLTDTAHYADIVLPATTSLEHNDIYYSYGHYTIQSAHAVIPPVGESKSNWQVAQLLAKAMNFTDPMFAKSESDLIDDLIASTKAAWPLPVDRAKLAADEPVLLPLPDNYKMQFATPSGKIEIDNPKVQPSLPDYLPAHMQGDNERFILINSPDPRVLDSSFNERPELTNNNIMVLMMHPDDANELHLHDGDMVIAKNQQGQATFTLKISERTKRGAVVSEGLWWQTFTKDGNTNRLTSNRTTDKANASTFYDVKVNIYPA